MSLGRAIRIAQMLGLHLIDGQGADAIPFTRPGSEWAEVEEMRRTWWVIYCHDRLVCGSTGWPVMINGQDVWCRILLTALFFSAGLLT